MYFIGAKALSNDLKGTGDMVIFVPFIYACQHAYNRIIMHSLAYPTAF